MRLHTLFLHLLLCVLPLYVPGANLIQNGSFEVDGPDRIGGGTRTVTGWRVTKGNVDIFTGKHPMAPGGRGRLATPAEGVLLLDLAGDLSATIEQRITGLIPGQTYQLGFSYEINNAGESMREEARFAWQLSDGLEGGGILTATDTFPKTTMHRFSLQVTATGPEATLRFEDESGVTDPVDLGTNGVLLDDVYLLPMSSQAGGTDSPSHATASGQAQAGADGSPSSLSLYAGGDGGSRIDLLFTSPIPVSGDFDGDGRADPGLYTPATGTWTLFLSNRGLEERNPGFAGPLPVVGDVDGDGKTDLGTYDPDTGAWRMQTAKGPWVFQFGFANTLPVLGDLDGDGSDDIGVYAPASGMWYVATTSGRFFSFQFGRPDTLPLLGDLDGDGTDDPGVFQTQTGLWEFAASREGAVRFEFGSTGTLPLLGDFDGDGYADFGIYSPEKKSVHVFTQTDELLDFDLAPPENEQP